MMEKSCIQRLSLFPSVISVTAEISKEGHEHELSDEEFIVALLSLILKSLKKKILSFWQKC